MRSSSARKATTLPTIASVVERIQRWDESALEPFVILTRVRLYRFCLHVTGDPTAADDLTQDVYIKVARTIGELRDVNKVFPWLFKLAKNLFIDQTRTTEHRLKTRINPDPEGVILDRIAAQGTVDPAALLSVQEILNRLEPMDRMLIVLAHHEGYTGPEIAQITDSTEDAVRSRLVRARREFFRLYGERDE